MILLTVVWWTEMSYVLPHLQKVLFKSFYCHHHNIMDSAYLCLFCGNRNGWQIISWQIPVATGIIFLELLEQMGPTLMVLSNWILKKLSDTCPNLEISQILNLKKLRAVKCNNSFQDYIYNSPILKVSIG